MAKGKETKVRSKIVFDKMLENYGKKHRKIKFYGLMKAAGYKDSYCRNPKSLKSTKTWKELLMGFVPELVVAEKQGEFTNYKAIRHFIFPKGSEVTDEEIKRFVEGFKGSVLRAIVPDEYGRRVAYYETNDPKSMKEALDMAHKLYGHYEAEKIEITKGKYDDLTDEELALRRKVLRDFLLRK